MIADSVASEALGTAARVDPLLCIPLCTFSVEIVTENTTITPPRVVVPAALLLLVGSRVVID